jgi:hypothetical protein
VRASYARVQWTLALSERRCCSSHIAASTRFRVASPLGSPSRSSHHCALMRTSPHLDHACPFHLPIPAFPLKIRNGRSCSALSIVTRQLVPLPHPVQVDFTRPRSCCSCTKIKRIRPSRNRRPSPSSFSPTLRKIGSEPEQRITASQLSPNSQALAKTDCFRLL